MIRLKVPAADTGMSAPAELDRLFSETSKLAFESGIRCGEADERCRMIEWVEKQNDHEASKVVTRYLLSKYEAKK